MTARASLVSWLVALAAVLAAAAALGQTGTARSWDLPLAEVLAELRQGGSVIFLRHTATDYAESDARMKSYSDCGGQRNLAEKGRQDARNIGIAIRALGVPVGRVLSSPYCRTLETAELAFGRSEIATDVRYAKPGETGAERYAPLRELLGAPPERGTNTVVVGHGAPFYALTQLRLAEGEIAVLKPLGNRFEILGRIKPDDWAALRAAARP
jgi:phosphohistidine phosphatase SixA